MTLDKNYLIFDNGFQSYKTYAAAITERNKYSQVFHKNILLDLVLNIKNIIFDIISNIIDIITDFAR